MQTVVVLRRAPGSSIVAQPSDSTATAPSGSAKK